MRVHDPKVTCVTNGDMASFFIPQPPPQPPPATMSPTCNLHHHKHPRPPTNHNNRPTTTLDHHTPTSPVSTTTSAPSTLPTATSRHAILTTSNPGHPKCVNHPNDYHVRRRPQAANDGQPPTSNIDRLATMKTANNSCQMSRAHKRQQQAHPWPQGSTGAARS